MAKELGCEIYIGNNKNLYHALYGQKEAIEIELGLDLTWKELPEKKASRIKAVCSVDISSTDDWTQHHKWLLDTVLVFQRVFGKRIKDCVG